MTEVEQILALVAAATEMEGSPADAAALLLDAAAFQVVQSGLTERQMFERLIAARELFEQTRDVAAVHGAAALRPN